ncbi:MAG TPA: hypothetical protein VMR94_13545 [Hyphomicrobiaceae bacterium]|nr:hypothetical protein [Hyphomicrobiaceae bacterium]
MMLSGSEIDEAPQAHRRLPNVLAEHAETIRIEHRLRPFAAAMAGQGVVDQ